MSNLTEHQALRLVRSSAITRNRVAKACSIPVEAIEGWTRIPAPFRGNVARVLGCTITSSTPVLEATP